jgi:hypothetical protein
MSICDKKDIYNFLIFNIIKARRESAELIQKCYRSKDKFYNINRI